MIGFWRGHLPGLRFCELPNGGSYLLWFAAWRCCNTLLSCPKAETPVKMALHACCMLGQLSTAHCRPRCALCRQSRKLIERAAPGHCRATPSLPCSIARISMEEFSFRVQSRMETQSLRALGLSLDEHGGVAGKWRSTSSTRVSHVLKSIYFNIALQCFTSVHVEKFSK